MPARSMKFRLPQLLILLAAPALLVYWTLLVYCDVWRPIPLGLSVRFDPGGVLVT